ncbi:MAG: hypothetical protein ABJB61_07200 [bacterium]
MRSVPPRGSRWDPTIADPLLVNSFPDNRQTPIAIDNSKATEPPATAVWY